MKAVCLQENLKSALNTASRNVASQPQLPVLANILLKTEKNKIRIAATNLSLGINLWINAKIEKKGEITIPAKIISEFVNSLPPGKLQLTVEKEKFLLSSPSSRATFNGLSASEFPSLPTIEKLKKSKKKSLLFQLDLKSFSQAISQTAFAAATDEGRPVLTGVLWQAGKTHGSLVATDGYRLSIKKLKLALPKAAGATKFIIPAVALQEAIRMEEEKETLKVPIVPGGKQIIFGFSDVEIISQLLEGEYPDFTKIVPQEGGTTAILDREEFLQAAQMAAIFAREAANIVKFKIEKNQLKITANTPQLGANESVLTSQVRGKANKIAFNVRFVLDFLKSTTAEEIEIEMSNPTSPAIFRPAKDKSYRHIIMPVRLQEEA